MGHLLSTYVGSQFCERCRKIVGDYFTSLETKYFD